MNTFSVKKDTGKKEAVFIGGNTKLLSDLDQAELERLHKNGDPRVESKPSTSAAAAIPALAETTTPKPKPAPAAQA